MIASSIWALYWPRTCVWPYERFDSSRSWFDSTPRRQKSQKRQKSLATWEVWFLSELVWFLSQEDETGIGRYTRYSWSDSCPCHWPRDGLMPLGRGLIPLHAISNHKSRYMSIIYQIYHWLQKRQIVNENLKERLAQACIRKKRWRLRGKIMSNNLKERPAQACIKSKDGD